MYKTRAFESFVIVSGSKKDLTAVSSRWCNSSPARQVTREVQGEFIQPESPGILAPELGNTIFCLLGYQKLVKNVVPKLTVCCKKTL